MGTLITLNDTLQITKEQGFPIELNLEKYLSDELDVTEFIGKEFEFKNKKNLRVYQAPPVWVFLVENKNGKWIYWGLCYVTETRLDNVNKLVSGKYKIIYIYSKEQIRMAHDMIDRNQDTKPIM